MASFDEIFQYSTFDTWLNGFSPLISAAFHQRGKSFVPKPAGLLKYCTETFVAEPSVTSTLPRFPLLPVGKVKPFAAPLFVTTPST